MKNFWLVAAFCCALFGHMLDAKAFSTEQNAAQNTDGTAKFADPDEQMPKFMVSPNNAPGGSGAFLLSAPSVTVPTMGEADNGAQAFDQAYAHQQVKQ